MTTAGIDLSLTNTGVVVLDNNNAFTATIKGKGKGAGRLVSIERELTDLLCGIKIDLLCIEGYAFGRANKAHQIGEIGGVIRRWLYLRDIKFVEVPPPSLKKFICKSGKADKETVILQVYKQWGFESPNSHEADAYGLARIAEAILTGQGKNKAQQEVIDKIKGAML